MSPGGGAALLDPVQASPAAPGTAPKRAGLVLAALIAVAAVANLGLAVANVALPAIGREFDASQTALNLVAVGYSLGLAASVLYFGAVGDRYGRKLLLILGMVVTVPADCLAAWAPNIDVLFGARVLGGLAAGMAYPTTLALIAALWSGPARTRAIALWAATGGAIAALGPLCSGILLYDLHPAARPTFWVAACAGIIVFGSLMGAMFIGQQFLQNVLGYSTVDAGLAILPAAAFMVVVAPRSAKLVEARGARFTLLFGYLFVFLGFVTMLLLWKENISYWKVALGYSFVGIGVGLAGTPASHSLTGSVPVKRVGMASGTADLQRDLGGAIMQSIFGALPTPGYAAAAGAATTASGKDDNSTDH